MKITVFDRVWGVDHAAAIVRDYLARGPERALFLLGCERCKSVCSLLPASQCRCCAHYKTRTGGGTVIFYPDDSKHHVRLMAMTEFVARMREEVA